VDLAVQTTGVVVELGFMSKLHVSDGDVLLKLYDEQQRADLAAQKAQAVLDRQNLDRAKELQRRGVGTETSLQSAQATADASAAQVAKLESVLAQMTVQAPFSGTVGIPRVDLGQYLTPGTMVATLQDMETMRADFSVPEQDIPLVKMGQQVRFGFTDEELPFMGKVTGIEPRVDPTTRLVLIRAEIENPDSRLSPGLFVRAHVILPSEDGVIVVPQTAVTTSLYGDFVYVVQPATDAKDTAKDAPAPAADAAKQGDAKEGDAKQDAAKQPSLVVHQVFVKTGRRSGGLIEVIEGLKIGDEVVTAGQNRLNNGSPVVIDNSVTPAPAPAGEAAAK
jgi:membrane fusion protein (multidrug efflux system)